MKRIIYIAIVFVACLQFAHAAGEVKDIHLTAKHVTSAFVAKGMSVPKLYLFRDGSLVYETPDGVGGLPEQFTNCIESEDKCHGPGDTSQKDTSAVRKLLALKGIEAPDRGVSLVSLEFGESMGFCPGCSAFYPAVEQAVTSSKSNVVWYRVKVEKNNYVDGVK